MLLLCSCAWFPPLAEIQRRPSPAKPDQVARAEERLKERETRKETGRKKGTELEEKKGEIERARKKSEKPTHPERGKEGLLVVDVGEPFLACFFLRCRSTDALSFS